MTFWLGENEKRVKYLGKIMHKVEKNKVETFLVLVVVVLFCYYHIFNIFVLFLVDLFLYTKI